MDVGTTAGITAGVVATALGGYMFAEPFNIQVRELDLAFPNLPRAFDGYTLLHLSDLHITKLGALEKRTMRIIESREVDACVVTGDVTAQPRASDNWRRLCSVIRHRDPIYMVLGNSEHKPWLKTDMLVDALSFEGLHMLVNSSATVTRGEDAINVVGVDDPYSRLDDLDAAFEGVDPNSFVLFLTHSPCTTPQAIEMGADLILAGHTHGGQVRLPGVGLVFTHMHRNSKLNDGLYLPADLSRMLGADAGGATLFVSRGIGTSRIHIRLMCRPEIVYITLRRSSANPGALTR